MPNQHQGARGRPKFEIPENQLKFLREFGFTWTQVQNLLGISRSTLLRRRNELGMNSGDEGERFSDINDEQLVDVIQSARDIINKIQVVPVSS